MAVGVPLPQQRRKGTGIGRRVWLFVSERASHVEEVGKYSIMRRTGLPGRDLRVLDPMLSYPSTILGRERSIVVNLEHIKAIVTANEVLMLNSTNPLVVQFVEDLQQRLSSVSDCGSNQVVLPFEFRAVEACLESACRCLESETETLEQEAYPALDELTSKISTLNLERVRQIKSRLVAITGRVQKVRDEVEHLLDDDNDMAEMYLTQKQLRFARSSEEQYNSNSTCLQLDGDDDDDDGDDDDDDDDDDDEKAQDSENSFKPNIEELEMLLEAYFVQVDGILQKLSDMSEYVDDTEDCINIMLDDKQNQLLQMGVMLSTANMLLNAAIVVVGIFGMNIGISLFPRHHGEYLQFGETTAGTIGGCVALYFIAVAWGKKKKLYAL